MAKPVPAAIPVSFAYKRLYKSGKPHKGVDFAAPAKAGHHRALVDIQESIEELRYYRRAVFTPDPGIDSETARAIAAEVSGSLTGEARPTV